MNLGLAGKVALVMGGGPGVYETEARVLGISVAEARQRRRSHVPIGR